MIGSEYWIDKEIRVVEISEWEREDVWKHNSKRSSRVRRGGSAPLRHHFCAKDRFPHFLFSTQVIANSLVINY